MQAPKTQRWPENRSFHRYRTQPPIEVIVSGRSTGKGVCRDLGIGGACVMVAKSFEFGETVKLTVRLPDFQEAMQIQAVVRNKVGDRYGFEFLDLKARDRERIQSYGRDSTISAFLFSPNPGVVRSAQQVLQEMGVTQVWRGSPDALPVPNPHIIIIDSDWPDFVDVAQLMREESSASRLIIVALVGRDVASKTVSEMGADIVLHKPLPRNWVERMLGTVVKLLGARAANERPREIVWSS